MAYSINYYDTSLEPTPITVADATVNTETSIKLVGKNYTNHGEIFNENFLWLLEIFASETDGDSPGTPTGAVRGQLWYNATTHQLNFYGQLQGLSGAVRKKETARVLELVGLSEVAKQRPDDLSHGMRKRVTIAQALIGEPEIVMLDEATAGLDPIHAREVRELVSSNSN